LNREVAIQYLKEQNTSHFCFVTSTLALKPSAQQPAQRKKWVLFFY